MGRMDSELQALVDQVADSLKNLPQDGVERQITIRVGGNNSGTINVGPTVNITPPPAKPRTYYDMDNQELRHIRKDLILKRNQARTRCFINLPWFFLIAVVLIAIAFAAWNVYLIFTMGKPMIVLTERTIIPFVVWFAAFFFSIRSLERIRKIESAIINENQSAIDAIDVILRRRA